MGYTVNPRWIDRLQELIDNYKPINEVIHYNAAARWLVHALAKANRLAKVIQLGAGVKRVTTVTNVCPNCKGTGALR